METPNTYYVWRRSDGYVGSTTYSPRNGRDTFEILLITTDWPQARQCIEDNRDERHQAAVASWAEQ